MRIAPNGGYDTKTKDRYRRQLWAYFAKACGDNVSKTQALLMPSSEGLEIDAALNAGFSEDYLWVCDKNPAIVATLKRKYPKIQTAGVPVSRAPDKIMEKVKRCFEKDMIYIANLDLCGCVGEETLTEIMGFVSGDVLPDASLIAVTVARGREHDLSSIKGTHDHWKRFTKSSLIPALEEWMTPLDHARLSAVLGAVSFDDGVLPALALLLQARTYVSSRVPMLWTLWLRYTPSYVTADGDRENAQLSPLDDEALWPWLRTCVRARFGPAHEKGWELIARYVQWRELKRLDLYSEG
jgi:hypothetical protein